MKSLLRLESILLSFNQVCRIGQVSHIIRKRVLSAKKSKKLPIRAYLCPNLKKILMETETEMEVIMVKQGHQAIRVVVKMDKVALVGPVTRVNQKEKVEEGFKKRVSNLTRANLIHR